MCNDHKTNLSESLYLCFLYHEGINLKYFKLEQFDISLFEISKVYDIRLQRYKD